MKITKKDTINDVFIDKGCLIKDIVDDLKARVLAFDVPDNIKGVACRRVEDITMRELEAIQKVDEKHLFTVMNVMLKMPEKKVMKSRFIDTYRYYLSVCDDLIKLAKKFSKLEIPWTADERAAQHTSPPLGMYDLVSAFCKLMPQYKLDEAWDLGWNVIYVELRKNRDKVLTERNLAQIQQRKHAKR